MPGRILGTRTDTPHGRPVRRYPHRRPSPSTLSGRTAAFHIPFQPLAIFCGLSHRAPHVSHAGCAIA